MAATPRDVLRARRELLPRLDASLARRGERDVAAAFAQLDALLEEARALGAWPPRDPLDGVEVDVRVARMLARVR